MIRIFCDVCGKELTDLPKERGRLRGVVGSMGFEVITSRYGEKDEGIYCHECVVNAINTTYQVEMAKRDAYKEMCENDNPK